MIIECPSCRSKYQYDEERFERKPSKKIKCAKCQQVFEIHNPAFADTGKVKVEAGESTNLRRQQKKEPDTTAQSPLPASTDKKDLALAMPAGRRLSLAIIDGPDAGQVHRIDRPRMTVGRSGADITLNDSEASRQHAAVEIRDIVCTLVDLGSTNGTIMNGERINGSIELQNHSEFQVGATTLMLIVTDES